MAREPLPVMDPFVQIAGSTWVVMNWYKFMDMDTGPTSKQPSNMTLERLTAEEEQEYRNLQNAHECFARVVTRVRKRLGYAKPHDTDSEEMK